MSGLQRSIHNLCWLGSGIIVALIVINGFRAFNLAEGGGLATIIGGGGIVLAAAVIAAAWLVVNCRHADEEAAHEELEKPEKVIQTIPSPKTEKRPPVGV